MNRFPNVSGTIKAAIVMALLAQASNAYSQQKGCWAEFFETSQYQGKHFLVNGPAQLQKLTDVKGENWDSRIDSLKIGPKAKLIVYDNPDFTLKLRDMARYPELMRAMGITEKDIKEEDEILFNANAAIHDLSDFNFHSKIRSLKVECIE